MLEEKKHEKHLELQSEKIRSVIGQIPSKLTQYGISIIAGVLVVLFSITYFLPYKRVYSGISVIHNISSLEMDSIPISILLKFDKARPTSDEAIGGILNIYSPQEEIISGKILELLDKRDTLGQQKSICLFPARLMKKVENSQTDFTLEKTSGTLLKRIIRKCNL